MSTITTQTTLKELIDLGLIKASQIDTYNKRLTRKASKSADEALAASLPTQLPVELDLTEGGDWHDINQDISKQLSNQTDWLVLDYQLVGYSLSPAE